MRTSLAATLFAVASIPLLGQMPSTPAPEQPGNPPTQQSTPPGETRPGAGPPTPASQPVTPAGTPTAVQAQPSTPASPVADMRPVNGKLVTRIDSKTAKTGDDVILQTESSVKTADGTEIPKGTKVIGHVIAVHPSGGQTSQLVLLFDRAELKDGKTMTIHSEIESVGSGSGDMATNAADREPSGAAAASDSPTAGDQGASGTSGAPVSPAAAAPSAGRRPAVGTIVSRNGNIAIRTTSIPGVMLANNAPGQHDPRLAQASGLLLGASKDVQLDSGTRFVLGVAPTAAGAPQQK